MRTSGWLGSGQRGVAAAARALLAETQVGVGSGGESVRSVAVAVRQAPARATRFRKLGMNRYRDITVQSIGDNFKSRTTHPKLRIRPLWAHGQLNQLLMSLTSCIQTHTCIQLEIS